MLLIKCEACWCTSYLNYRLQIHGLCSATLLMVNTERPAPCAVRYVRQSFYCSISRTYPGGRLKKKIGRTRLFQLSRCFHSFLIKPAWQVNTGLYLCEHYLKLGRIHSGAEYFYIRYIMNIILYIFIFFQSHFLNFLSLKTTIRYSHVFHQITRCHALCVNQWESSIIDSKYTHHSSQTERNLILHALRKLYAWGLDENGPKKPEVLIFTTQSCN